MASFQALLHQTIALSDQKFASRNSVYGYICKLSINSSREMLDLPDPICSLASSAKQNQSTLGSF